MNIVVPEHKEPPNIEVMIHGDVATMLGHLRNTFHCEDAEFFMREATYMAHPLDDFDAKYPGFSLRDAIGQRVYPPPDNIAFTIVEDARFGEIYRMRLEDLSEYFSFLWYEHEDDLIFMDIEGDWFGAVTKSGSVYVITKP